MVKKRSNPEYAVGKLISSIQSIWIAELGGEATEKNKEVMKSAHLLLQAAKVGSIEATLGNRTVTEFLGKEWVQAHTAVWPRIQLLEALLLGEGTEEV